MTLTVTADVQSILAQLNENTEIRDAAGNTIGFFTPAEVAEAELDERVKKMIDPAEIERRKQQKGAVPFEEVMKRLKSMESSE